MGLFHSQSMMFYPLHLRVIWKLCWIILADSCTTTRKALQHGKFKQKQEAITWPWIIRLLLQPKIYLWQHHHHANIKYTHRCRWVCTTITVLYQSNMPCSGVSRLRNWRTNKCRFVTDFRGINRRCDITVVTCKCALVEGVWSVVALSWRWESEYIGIGSAYGAWWA